jgi:hypothetical protein
MGILTVLRKQPCFEEFIDAVAFDPDVLLEPEHAVGQQVVFDSRIESLLVGRIHRVQQSKLCVRVRTLYPFIDREFEVQLTDWNVVSIDASEFVTTLDRPFNAIPCRIIAGVTIGADERVTITVVFETLGESSRVWEK